MTICLLRKNVGGVNSAGASEHFSTICSIAVMQYCTADMVVCMKKNITPSAPGVHLKKKNKYNIGHDLNS